MCSKKGCTRHEFDRGLCLVHLRETITGKGPVRRTRKKKETNTEDV